MTEKYYTSKLVVFILCQCWQALIVGADVTEPGAVPLWLASGTCEIMDYPAVPETFNISAAPPDPKTQVALWHERVHACCLSCNYLPAHHTVHLLIASWVRCPLSSSCPFLPYSHPRSYFFLCLQLQGWLRSTFVHWDAWGSQSWQNLWNNGWTLHSKF